MQRKQQQILGKWISEGSRAENPQQSTLAATRHTRERDRDSRAGGRLRSEPAGKLRNWENLTPNARSTSARYYVWAKSFLCVSLGRVFAYILSSLRTKQKNKRKAQIRLSLRREVKEKYKVSNI